MMAPAPLRIVHAGIRYGVTADGQQVAWLPPAMWAAAAALVRQMDEMNATAERMQMLYDAAENAAFAELAKP
jgi:hypothetical protein